MIRIFGATDTDFSSNGDIVIEPSKARVKKIDNGEFMLDIEAPIKYRDYLTAGRIIIANTPQGEQAFRIRNTVKTDYKITASCWHVSYDLFYNYFVYELPISGTLGLLEPVSSLLQRLPQYIFTSGTFPFVLSTDTTSALDYCGAFEYSSKSVFDILSDVVSRFGLHMVRDNFNFALNTSIGQDRGVNIRYGSNMKDMTKTEKWDNVCTICFPIGKEGVRMINGGYVGSQTQYTYPYVRQVNFGQEDIKREYYSSAADYKTALQTNLATIAQAYVDEACFPEVTYDFKAHLDGILEVGDTVKVIDDNIGIDLLTNVKSFEYDCLTGLYTDVTFGNVVLTVKGLGKRVIDVFTNQIGGIIQDKQLSFDDSGVVKWVTRNNS